MPSTAFSASGSLDQYTSLYTRSTCSGDRKSFLQATRAVSSSNIAAAFFFMAVMLLEVEVEAEDHAPGNGVSLAIVIATLGHHAGIRGQRPLPHERVAERRIDVDALDPQPLGERARQVV